MRTGSRKSIKAVHHLLWSEIHYNGKYSVFVLVASDTFKLENSMLIAVTYTLSPLSFLKERKVSLYYDHAVFFLLNF
jgi:hypothetical protein